MAIIGWRKKKTIPEAERNEAIRNIFGEEGEYNKFYDTTSAVYRVAEFVFLAAFLAFIIYSAVVNAGNITYENFDYIIRNFAVSLDENALYSSSVFYTPDEDADISLFGNGIAVCSSAELEIFSATGRKTCSERHGYASPVLAASDKYVIVYEKNSTKYTVYNSFSKVWSDTLDHTIKGVEVSNSGYYAIITRTDEYIGAVALYDSSFKMVNRYLKNAHVVSVALSEDGMIAIVTVSVDDSGEYQTEVMISKIGESAALATEQYSGVFPLECSFTESGIMLVCSDRVLYLDMNAAKMGEFVYPTGEITMIKPSDASVLLLIKGDAVKKENRALVISKDGLIAEAETQGTVISADIIGENAYILTEKGIFSVSTQGTLLVERDGVVLGDEVLAYSVGKLYYCASSSAKVIEID